MCEQPEVNALEGVGMIEAPGGSLIHHYKVNEEAAITWAHLIVATGHNNLAIGRRVRQVSEHFIASTKLNEGMLNRVSTVVRDYDPCFIIVAQLRLGPARDEDSTDRP
jgi:NAD-reducing hydrogenase large subunit